ncbi:hypothetical protein KJ885_01095 [Patescibacteria group bacterium]|nr:hypothetical protein [Patescibacteria group bacterium]
MSNESKPTNKKETPKMPPATTAKFTVMPQEFRKATPRKKIPKKFLIFGGAGAGVLILIIVAVMFVISGQPKQIVQEITPTVPTAPVATIPAESATTTPEIPSSLFPTTPATTEEETPTQPIVAPGELVQGTDYDADGLTEKEEAIFQTDSKRPDTDADGFLDGNEVFHLYNPSAIAPVGLIESGIAKLYRNAGEGYSIFYPALWATSSTSDASTISFLSDDKESINIVIKEASAGITLRSWYISEYPDADINSMQSYTSKQGYQGLQDSNRLNTYIKQDKKVFIVNYDLGGITTIWYRRLYDMMLNSLEIE